MSASSEYESTARQDYGPATSSENVYEPVSEHKLADTMNIQSIRTPVLRAVPLSPNQGDPEPDSTNHESIIHSNKSDKEVEYHIAEKRSDTDMSVETLANIVRIEESHVDNVGHISYPLISEGDDSSDGNYVENSATLIQAPLSTAIVQNVAKLPQNFTINVDAAVSNITAIQNVSQDVAGQTLWLPTILATSATAGDSKTDEDRSQPGVSQIIITSESYSGDQVGRRSNIVTETSYITRPKTSKVQILSNISLPKNPTYSQQYVTQTKDIATPVYATQNHVYRLSTNVVSQKHLNSSVLCSKTQKNQSLIGCSTLTQSVINSSPIKNVAYSHTFTKGTNLNKTLNKVNNGANLNAMVAASSGGTQCHILSRVVSGPNKMSVHSGRKSVNTFKGSKSGQVSSQKNQSRPIKIIQQAGPSHSAHTPHKSEVKSWPVTNVAYKNQQSTYGMIESGASKIIQKVGSPPGKSQPMSLSKFPAKGERLVLQSPCGPVLLSTAPLNTSGPRGPHYVQSGSTPNLRYVQTYGTADNQLSTVSQVSANQQLTAQILQSLSQPKLMLQQNPSPLNHNLTTLTPISTLPIEEAVELRPYNQKRIVMGDKSTMLTADDLIGTEERPNLSEELRRYSIQPLAIVMLDHTYALPAQKQPSATTTPGSPPPAALVSPPPAPPMEPCAAVPAASHTSLVSLAVLSPVAPPPAPLSPLKRHSPVIVSTATYDLSVPSTQTAAMSLPSTMPISAPHEDDAASCASSIDGERVPGGSDTETAPEGEDEGKTRCVCDFTHDDGYMICCDRCGEWQHVDCMGIDRNDIPDAYMCELCLPRAVDRRHARAIQLRKREELSALAGSDSEEERTAGARRKRLLTVTTYTDTSGSYVTTYNSIPPLPPIPQPPVAPPKRGPKRPKKTELVRKGTKRKFAEKRVKRKKEMMMNRTKYGSSLANQSHWQESYELAVTNHYSPELRAKIVKYSSKLGSQPSMAYAMNAHLCTTVPHAGGKILIATKDLKESTPIIELRGKYMLSTQHRPQLQNSARASSQKPGPFVFFYRLPKDNTQICIDTRTYGNEARFVRRSCKPNAELQHCIVKGTLHVYLVTIGVIQSNTEITVGHDSDGSKQPCACGNPKHCKVNGLNTPLPPRKSMDYPPREKRSRNRCFSSSSPVSPPAVPAVTTQVKEFIPSILTMKQEKSPIKHEYPPLSPAKPVVMALFDDPIKAEVIDEPKPEMDLTAKEEMKPEDIDEPDFGKVETVEEKKEEIKPVYIEPEPELIKEEEIKSPVIEEKPIAIPLPPKLEERRKSKLDPIEIKRDKDESFSDDEQPIIKSEKPEKIEIKKLKDFKEDIKIDEQEKEDKPLKEKEVREKEIIAKSACHDRSSRSSRTTCVNQDSMDDKTDDSQDKIQTTQKEKEKRKMTREERKMEAIMKAFERMEKDQLRKQEVKERQKRRESDPHPNSMDKDDDEEIHCSTKKRRRRKGRARTTSQSTRRRLNSADSDMVTSGDEAPPLPRTPPQRLMHDNTHEESRSTGAVSEPVTEDLGLSSACLLVEAAVGSVESAFKLPKTKKTMATEWIGRSPERTPSPYRSPYRPTIVTPSLESLVRVASTMIGDLSGNRDTIDNDESVSPPRTPGRDRNRPPKKSRRITRSTPPAEVPEVTPQILPQHSAKKRWLRQAISEESDPPPTESPPNEMITPLKKRRLARESLSCEPNTICPVHEETSPMLTSEDSPVKDDSLNNRQYNKVRNIMENMYGRDRTRSDSGPGSDDQGNLDNELLNVDMKGPHDTEHIRRIIGVPTPEEDLPPDIPKPDDIKSNNNNVDDEAGYTKVIPMDIDTTMPHPRIQDRVDVGGAGCQSADTSGNSSPQRDDMDDIQKKIHSFHTENIMILKSRNKKPKEKRKKVNLNFDLNMVDDRVSIRLRTDEASQSPEVNGDVHAVLCPENIPLPPVESIPLPAPENIPLPEEPTPMPLVVPPGPPAPETIPLPSEPMTPVKRLVSPERPIKPDRPCVLETSPLPFSSRFNSTGLFSGIFGNISQTFTPEPLPMPHPAPIATPVLEDAAPTMSIIKSAIDRTTSLDTGLFDNNSMSASDEMRSVREILSRVNSMDSSAILSGVLRSSSAGAACSPSPTSAATPVLTLAPSPRASLKSFPSRVNDPRLNPPPQDKPKPIRRKLSITEYRKRHKGATNEDTSEPSSEPTAEATESSSSSGTSGGAGGPLSPHRLEAAAAAAADELEHRLHRELVADHLPKGVFDAEPTASERQRENLSSRLRREFGLALPEDEEARADVTNAAPPDLTDVGDACAVIATATNTSAGAAR